MTEIGERAADRRVLALTGADRIAFLQGLVTNDVRKLGEPDRRIVYAALLSPQGKYLADFFLVGEPERVLLDANAGQAEALARRLAMYRLRADVQILPAGLNVLRGLGPAPEDALPDPRDPRLGWRRYTTQDGTPPVIDWDAIRVEAEVPEAGVELIPDESYILEAGFERLHGVDFRKGCYVGQEVTARMKHRTELRKGIVRVTVAGEAAPGTEITSGGKAAGRLLTRAGDRALAYLRFDRAEGMEAGAARIALD